MGIIKKAFRLRHRILRIMYIILFFTCNFALLSYAGQLKDNSKFHMIINPINGNQKILNDKFEVLLSSQVGYSRYYNTKSQDIGIVYDEKTNEEKFLYKNYIRYNSVDLNNIIYGDNIQRSSYKDEIADWYWIEKEANYDGGSYRYANKIIFYSLDGKDIIKEFNDVSFKKFYNGNFYYSTGKENPNFYIWNAFTDKTEYIGKYSNCYILDEGNLIMYQCKKDDMVNEVAKDEILICARTFGTKKIISDYYYFDTILINKQRYFIICYNKRLYHTDNWSDNSRFYNLLDSNFNFVFVNDFYCEDFENENNNISINKITNLINNNVSNNNISFYDSIGLNQRNLIYVFQTKECTLYMFKNDKGYVIYNEKGKRCTNIYKNYIDIAKSSEHLFDTYFMTADDNDCKIYFYIDKSFTVKEISYDRNTKLILADYGYYAKTNIDIEDSAFSYDEDTYEKEKKKYKFNIYNIHNSNFNMSICEESSMQDFEVIRCEKDNKFNDYFVYDLSVYNSLGKLIFHSDSNRINVIGNTMLIVSEYNNCKTMIYNFEGEKVIEFDDFYCRNAKKCLYDNDVNRFIVLSCEKNNKRFDKIFDVVEMKILKDDEMINKINKQNSSIKSDNEKKINIDETNELVHEYDTYDRFSSYTKYAQESKYWEIKDFDFYSLNETNKENEKIKNGYKIVDDGLGKSLIKNNKVIISECKYITNCNDNYFTYQKGFKYGIMNYIGDKLAEFSIYDDTEEEYSFHDWSKQ